MFVILLFMVLPVKSERVRTIVTTDIGGSDPDDQQSLIHLLTMLDCIDLEGFIYQQRGLVLIKETKW